MASEQNDGGLNATAEGRKFWAIKEVAYEPDGTGRYRVAHRPMSDLYDWTPENLEQARQLASLPLHATIVGPLTRADYDLLCRQILTGYADESAPDAFTFFGQWVPA